MANVLVFTELHDGHVKPVALEILGKLAGQTADVAVIGDLSAEEVAAYLAGGEWHGKAGGYAIQGSAEGLVQWIQGSHSGVMGLPLFETRALLKAAGFAVG